MNWQHKIKIRDISEDEGFDKNKELEIVPNYGKRMKRRLDTYDNFIPSVFGRRFWKVKTLYQFNSVLDSLYDFCDSHKIWVEW